MYYLHLFIILVSTLPIVRLQYDALSTDTFSAGNFALIQDSDTLALPMEIRHRGTSSVRYQKKAYAVKLYDEEGEKKDTSLLGMRSDNYWILDAMAIDKARMRNRVAMDLWLDFSAKPSYQDLEPQLCNGYNGKFVEVYVNEDYEGLYCLMERVDRKQLKLKKNKKTTINGILYKSISWDGSFFGALTPYDNDTSIWMRYEYVYPDVEDSLINWEPLYNAMDFVNTAPVEDFANEAPERYDIPVFRDYYLYTALLSARDNMGKNLYLSYYNINQDSKLVVTPWDIDHSFGRIHNSSEEAPDKAFRFNVKLYERLKNNMPDYYNELLARYEALRQDWFSLESLKQRFTDYFRLFDETGVAEREMERWNDVDNIALDFAIEEEYIYTWLEQRLVYTDSLFQYHPVSTGTENIYTPSAGHKIFRNGQLYLKYNGTMYNVQGVIVERP